MSAELDDCAAEEVGLPVAVVDDVSSSVEEAVICAVVEATFSDVVSESVFVVLHSDEVVEGIVEDVVVSNSDEVVEGIAEGVVVSNSVAVDVATVVVCWV